MLKAKRAAKSPDLGPLEGVRVGVSEMALVRELETGG